MKNKRINILKNKEQGSITLFTIISIIFFLIISIGVYINISNKSTIQVSEVSKIKSEYQISKEQMDEEYEQVVNNISDKVIINMIKKSDNSEYVSGMWTNDTVKVTIEFPDYVPDNEKIIYINGKETKYEEELIIDETTTIKVNFNGKEQNAQINIDKVLPKVTIAADKTSPTNASSIKYTFTFSEEVTDFTADDIQVTNGTKGEFAGSGKTYTLVVTNNGSTTQTVKVNANVCTDTLGKGNIASNTLSITIDRTAPTVNITANKSSPTNASSITYTFTFSENVTGFVASDITVTNGSKGTFSGSGKTYTLVVTNSGSTTQTVKVNAGVCTDSVGNGNTASNTLNITIDRTAPTVKITANKSSPTNASSITYTFTFSENVTGFVASDITVTNGSKGTFSGSGKTYTLVVTNSGSTTQTVKVNAGVCTDSVGNGNTASNTLSISIDRTAPTITISTQLTNPSEVVSTYMSNNYTNTVTDTSGVLKYGVFKAQKFAILITTKDSNKISSIEYKVSTNNVTANATNYNNLGNVKTSGSASNKASGTQTTTFANKTLSTAGLHYIYVKAVDSLGNTSYAKTGLYVYTDMQKFVVLCYNNILGRAPEYNGFQNWVDMTQKVIDGGDPILDYAQTNDRKIKAIVSTLAGFYYSDEYTLSWWNSKSEDDIIRTFFWGALRRTPASSEITFWRGRTRDELFWGIVASTEAIQKYGNYSLNNN